jgi:uncharacterized protein (TIGR02452 family)
MADSSTLSRQYSSIPFPEASSGIRAIRSWRKLKAVFFFSPIFSHVSLVLNKHASPKYIQMGRTEPSRGLPPPSFRRDARAKKAKATLNKVIPALLSAHPRAQRGVDSSELILVGVEAVPTAAATPSTPQEQQQRAKPNKKKQPKGGRQGRVSPITQASTTLSSPSLPQPSASCPRTGPLKVTLRVTDTLVAARSLLLNQETGKTDLGNRTRRVAILNMASPLSPGGGFVNGASSQEESLCMRTTLLPALRDGFYRLPELAVVFTPDVLVFRDETGGEEDMLAKGDRWFVDCVSAAMLRMPETEVDGATGRGRYVDRRDRGLVLAKMRGVMEVCCARGVKRVVLGAWGCGAYGNPVGEIAAAWRKVLLGGGASGGNGQGSRSRGGGNTPDSQGTWDEIEEVVFAIKDEGLAGAFETAFGDGLEREEEEDGNAMSDGSEEDAQVLRMRELQEKIRDLEVRLAQTKIDQVRTGLEKVLADLRSQIVEPDGDEHVGVDGVAHDDDDDDEDTTDEQVEDMSGEDTDGSGDTEGESEAG